jgi:hypothetical protein
MDHPWVNLPPCDEEKAVVPLSSARNLIRTKLSAAKLASASHGSTPLSQWLNAGWRRLGSLWIGFKVRVQRAPRLLLVSETASLGDRRIVSVVQFEHQRFLIGGGPSSVTLLTRLPDVGANDAPADCAARAVPGPGGSQ